MLHRLPCASWMPAAIEPGEHAAGTYSSGERVYAGLYLGYANGMVTSRTGISAPWVQDFFQNGVHRFITRSSPYFDSRRGTPTGLYSPTQYSNPWTLY